MSSDYSPQHRRRVSHGYGRQGEQAARITPKRLQPRTRLPAESSSPPRSATAARQALQSLRPRLTALGCSRISLPARHPPASTLPYILAPSGLRGAKSVCRVWIPRHLLWGLTSLARVPSPDRYCESTAPPRPHHHLRASQQPPTGTIHLAFLSPRRLCRASASCRLLHYTSA